MTGATPIRVLLVDDHALFRKGLAILFREEPDFEVVGEAADGMEAIAQAAALRPDVILMDRRMPRAGIAMVRGHLSPGPHRHPPAGRRSARPRMPRASNHPDEERRHA